jgi:hypothetical protein
MIVSATVTRYSVPRLSEELEMAMPAERMRAMRARRRTRGLRELRLILPDARLQSVRRRVATQVTRLDRTSEEDALSWIEAVSEFDVPSAERDDEAR